MCGVHTNSDAALVRIRCASVLLRLCDLPASMPGAASAVTATFTRRRLTVGVHPLPGLEPTSVACSLPLGHGIAADNRVVFVVDGGCSV